MTNTLDLLPDRSKLPPSHPTFQLGLHGLLHAFQHITILGPVIQEHWIASFMCPVNLGETTVEQTSFDSFSAWTGHGQETSV